MTDFRFICVPFILFILDLKILSVTERHTNSTKIAKTSSRNLHNTNNLCANEVNETVFSIWGDSF